MVFGLAATGGNVKEMKEVEILQRKAWRDALELPRATPKEFVEKEFGATSQTGRSEKASIKLLSRMVEREGKIRESIVERWDVRAVWIKKIRNNMKRNGIEDYELEDLRSRDAEKRINERRNKDWWEAVNSKRSLRWYEEMHDRGWKIRNW